MPGIFELDVEEAAFKPATLLQLMLHVINQGVDFVAAGTGNLEGLGLRLFGGIISHVLPVVE